MLNMKVLITICFCFLCLSLYAQKNDMKNILLQQIKNTHNNKAWFVPLTEAIAGLSSEQAAQKSVDNHAVGQLVHHILFWTERNLQNFKTGNVGKFDGNNEATFDKFNQMQWDSLLIRIDQVLTELEDWVANASEEELKKYVTPLTNISIHNAYHIGQIISTRKTLGLWKR